MQDKHLERALLNRALIFHVFYNINKVCQFMIGNSLFLKNECISSEVKCPPYYKELMDPMREPLQIVWIASIFVGLAIDLLCIKWRKMAHSIMYMETFLHVVEMCLPLRHVIEMPLFYRLVLGSSIFLLTSTASRTQLIFHLVLYGIFLIFVTPVLYE